jgi:hypothetical protein
MTEQPKEFKMKSKAQNLRELRDMRKCPDCGKIQSAPREAGDDCENPDCEGYVVMLRKYPTWQNLNWG